MKLNALKFALTGGIYTSVMAALLTICAIWKIPGYVEFANNLAKFYGFYGYSVTWIGVLVGGLLGVHRGLFPYRIVWLAV